MEDIKILNASIFLAVFLIFTFLYYKGKSKYEKYIKAVSKKEYPMRDFLSIGFAFLEIIKYRYNTSFDRNLRKKMLQLYDEDYSEFYFRLNIAMAVSLFFIGLFMAALISMATGDIMLFFIGIGIAILLPYAHIKDINNKIQKIHFKVAMDLPDYISKVTILTSAGLNLRAAIKKVSLDMCEDTPLYSVMSKAINNIDNGMNEKKALDQVAVRLNTMQMRKFISVVEQNLQRGGQDVGYAMQSIGEEMWSNRKSEAKRLAQEAETKLLFPMMLMMLSVMIITVVPAVLQIQM